MPKLTRRTTLAGAAALLATHRAQAATTLEFTTWQAEEPGFGAWWKELIAAFEQKNRGTQIKVTGIPYKDYLDQLTIRFASNRPPPLFELNTDTVGAFASQDWLQPLDDRIKQSVIGTDKWSGLQQDLSWDGKMLGVLLMGYAFMLFYNQALLDQAGVTLPASWDEWLAAVPKVTQRDRGIFGLSAVTTEYPTIPLDMLRTIRWSGGSIVRGNAYNLTDPKVVQAVELYRRVVGGNAPLGANSTIIRQLFTDGKTGFLIDGPWVWALLDHAPKEVRPNLKMAKCPFAPPVGGASNSIHIAAGLDQATQDAAWSFIAFLTQPKWQQRYTELTAAPAARLDALTPELAASRPELKAINEAVIGVEPNVPRSQALHANYNEFTQIMQRTCVRVLSTSLPVIDILKDTQAQLERAVPLT